MGCKDRLRKGWEGEGGDGAEGGDAAIATDSGGGGFK